MTRIELMETASMKLAEAVLLLVEIAREMAEIVEFRAATIEGQLLSAEMESVSRLIP